MNPDSPLTPRDENEIRLTALLLGELSSEEAEKVRAEIAADPKLAALYGRLSHAGELLREACALPEPAVPARAKLSSERRERLLAHFKSAAPRAVVVPMKRDWKWVVPLGLAAMLIAVLGGSLLILPLSVSIRGMSADFAAVDGSMAAPELTVAPPANPTPHFPTFAPDTPQITAPALNTITTTNTPTPALEIAPSAPIITPVQTDAMSKALESASKTMAKGASVRPPPGAMGGREGGISGQQIAAAVPAPASPATDHFFADSPAQPAKPALKPSRRAPGEKVVDSDGIAQLDGGSIAPPSLPRGGLTFTGSGTISPAPSSTPTDGSTNAGLVVESPRPAPNGRVSKSKSDATGDRIAGLKAPKAPLPAATPAAMAAAGAAGDDRRSWAGRVTAPEPMEQEISELRAPSPVVVSGAFSSTAAAKPSEPVLAGEAFGFSINGGRVAGAPGQPARPRFAQANEVDAPALGISGVASGKVTSGTELPNSSSTVVTGGKLNENSGKWGSQPGMVRGWAFDSAGQPAAEEKPMGVFGGGGGGEKVDVAQIKAQIEQTKAELARATAERDEQKQMAETLKRSKDEADEKVATANKEIERYRAGVTKAGVTGEILAADSPAYFKQSLSPELRAKGEQTKKELAETQNFYDSRRNDIASKRADEVLALDPADAEGRMALENGLRLLGLEPDPDPADAERRMALEKGNKAIDEFGTTAFNETRSRAIGVSPITAGIRSGNNAINQNAIDALVFGIAGNSGRPSSPVLVPLAETEVEQSSAGIGITPIDGDKVTTRAFKVSPDFIKQALTDASRADSENASRTALKDLLTANGMPLGPDAVVSYAPASSKLIIRDTPEQLGLFDAIVSGDKDVAEKAAKKIQEDVPAPTPTPDALVPQPEVQTAANAFSTFSLNVTDVAFKLAAARLEQGNMPEPASMRSEEFINAFDYRDPEPAPGAPLACNTEYARYPFAQNRDLLRCSVKTAAAGRQPGRALNLVLLVDNSGSMERADRVRILNEALRVLAAQLQPQDKLSVITFARTPRLWADGVAGDQASATCARVSEITPQGGTNIDAALDLGYATALRHYQPGSINRVVLLTDGAANLGDVHPDALKKKVEAYRQKGVALDCFGIGWEGLNDDLLEQLSRNGDGRYGFINTPEEAATEFAAQLAGALRVAASDVKVQIEFNPRRVTAYRQIGYAKHQLTKEQFRDNTVDAAEIGAAEAGNALYVVEVNPSGEGDLGTMRVRFKVPGTSDYREHEWAIPFATNAPPLEQASPALRLAGAASAFSELLAGSPFATEVTSDRLLALLNGIPSVYGADPRPQKLEWMIRQAKSISGR